MKRCHGAVSVTPAMLIKRGKRVLEPSPSGGLLGTPVEGLTGMQVAADTPESDDRPARPIPETTQRRLEGFCLNTPLSLSQQAAADAETPTLGGKPPVNAAGAPQQQQQAQPQDGLQQQQDASQLGLLHQQQQQHLSQRDGQALQQQQQQQHHHSHDGAPLQQQHQQQPQHHGCGAAPGVQGRHRLANISNLPQPTPSALMAAPPSALAKKPPGSMTGGGPQPMHTGGGDAAADARGRAATRQQRHVMFQPDLVSPPPSLTRAAAAAGVQRTPFVRPLSSSQQPAATPGSVGGTALLMGTPGSCGGDEDGDDDDLGFVLHVSQTYVRHSQPAISPSVAAGLSAQPEEEEEEEEEPFTTPSQDSREPRLSPSNATSLATTTLTTSFELPQSLAAGAAAAAVLGAAASQQQQQHQSQLPVLGAVGSQQPPQGFVASSSQAAAAAAPLCGGGATPGDGLLGAGGLLLGGAAGCGPLLDETTTPELEAVGLGLLSQEPGGSQQQQQQQLSGLHGAAAAAAAAGRGGTSARAQQAAAGAAGPSGGGAAAGAGGGRSGGRGGGVVCEEVTAKQVLFPIFRPKSTRKCVILVRHGESTYNKQDASGRNWADPHIFDAPLTTRGRQQAIAARDRVREQLDKHAHLGATLWLSSPLTRALQTMLLAAPQVEGLAAGSGRAGSQPEHRVMVLSLIAEHCATSGDVGRPASELAAAFPALAAQLGELPEAWWFNPTPEEGPNCAVQKVFNKTESVEFMRRRVSEFSRWLHARPEQLVVAFGHSTFWKYFANTRSRLRNCEVLQMWW